MEPPRYNSIREKLDYELQDPVSFDLLTDAVTLSCGHNVNKDTINKIKKVCPLCSAPFTTYVNNPTIKNIAVIVEAMPQEIEKNPTKKAEQLFENAKNFAKKNNIAMAIQLLSEALDDSPNYEKAIGYRECLLDMLEIKQEIKQVEKKQKVDEFKTIEDILVRFPNLYKGLPDGGQFYDFQTTLRDILCQAPSLATKIPELTHNNSNNRTLYREQLIIMLGKLTTQGLVTLANNADELFKDKSDKILALRAYKPRPNELKKEYKAFC